MQATDSAITTMSSEADVGIISVSVSVIVIAVLFISLVGCTVAAAIALVVIRRRKPTDLLTLSCCMHAPGMTYGSWLRPGSGAEYCDQPVCLCVCLSVREHISGTAGPIGHEILCAYILCGRGSVLLRRRYATLCTSGFMDDVAFGRNGRDTERRRLMRVATAIPGRSLMFMNALFASVVR